MVNCCIHMAVLSKEHLSSQFVSHLPIHTFILMAELKLLRLLKYATIFSKKPQLKHSCGVDKCSA